MTRVSVVSVVAPLLFGFAPVWAQAVAASPTSAPPMPAPRAEPNADPSGVRLAEAAHSAKPAAATGHDAPAAAAAPVAKVEAPRLCQGFGPQTPRDIAVAWGRNARMFNFAPPAVEMNLCNIHFHTQAEHKGPGFNIYAGTAEHGGWMCNETPMLTAQELTDPAGGHGACHGLKPGDTVEVHWVYSTCDVAPGQGLGSCLNDACKNPQLRVESQVFLAVNDPNALDFAAFDHAPAMMMGFHQPKALPGGTGEPVVFAGSTTGTSYDNQICSPFQVTWSVRPQCTRVDISSLHRWCENNDGREDHAHGVRPLVTAPELLAPIQ